MAKKDYFSMVRERENTKGKSNSSSSRGKKDYYDLINKKSMEETIGFDTLQGDMDSLSKQYSSVYDGWQTNETMKNVATSMKSMQNRLTTLSDYVDKYGMDGVDDLDAYKTQLSSYTDNYSKALGSLNDQRKLYGMYKDGDSYNKYLKNLQFNKDFEGLSYEDVQSKMKEYGEGTDEYDYLSKYTGYSSLKDFDKALANAKGKEEKPKTKASTYLEGGNNGNLGSSYGAMNSAPKTEKKESSYLDELESARNRYRLDNASESYEYLRENEDFEEKSQYVSTKTDGAWDRMTSQYGMGYGDLTYEYINNANGIRSEIEDKERAWNSENKGDESFKDKGYDRLNDDEIAYYNYLYAENPKKAKEFLEDIEVSLAKRVYDERTKRWESVADSSKLAEAGMSALSVPANTVGGIIGGIDAIGDMLKGKEYNPYSYYKMPSNFATDTRQYVGENIAERTEGSELPIIDNPYVFMYNAGMSMADSMANRLLLGEASNLVMSSSAYQQRAKQLKEEGASEDEVQLGALASGTAEYLFEKYELDNLLGTKNSDSIWSVAKNLVKQSGSEALGEVGTEFANIISDMAIRGESSEYSKKYQDYMDRGFSAMESLGYTFADGVKQLAQAGIAGGLSGGVMGGAFAGVQYSDLKSKGQQIKANERTQDIFDMFTPEEAETYKIYDEYAKKGVTAENIKDAQLGNLYATKEAYASETLESRKSTKEERNEAARTMDVLSNYMNTKGVTTKDGQKVSIDNIKKVDGDTVFVTDQGEKSANDLNLSVNETKMVEYTENMSEEMASTFVSQYDGKSDIDSYKAQFDLAYSYGENEFGVSAILEKTRLTSSQASAIYTMAKDTKYAKRQSVVDNLVKEHTSGKFVQGKVNDSVIDYTDSGKGEVNWSDLSKTQQRHITFQNALYRGLGINVKWTTKGIDGKIKYNGHYVKENNEIVLDVYAGVNKYGEIKDADLAIMRTSSHEITHWMETKSPEMYKALKEHIFETLNKEDNIDDATRISAYMKEYSLKTEEEAINEIVAQGCEDMLAMSDIGKEVLGKMTESEKKTFFDKVKEVFNDMIKFLDEMLGQFTSKSYEAQILRQNKESLEKQLALWEEALKNAVEVNQAMVEKGVTDKNLIESVEKVGISIDAETNSAYPSEEFSRRTWEESDYAVNREVAAKNLAKALKISQKKALKYIDDINSVARMIADDKVRLDYEPNIDDSASVMKPNSDYKWSIDMSTLCAKRLLFTGTFDAIQKALPNTVFNSEDIVKLRKMMMDRAYEVACGICYVESTRREIGAITQQFIDNYKESQRTGKPITRTNSKGNVVELKKTKDEMKTTTDKSSDRFIADKDYTPTLADLNTTDIDIVKREHPLVYEAYLNFMNARGQAKPKLLETRAEYKGEIAKTYKRKKDGSLNNSTVTMNESGGLRLQSFSDFEVAHLIDMMQVVMDMSNVGLYSQAYTKVPAFAEVFGGTGVKINLSLIAKGSGLDADGNLIFDDVEGINHEEAFRLREKYSKNVGTILVGKSDEHIIKAMADPRIDYVIPFHKSSWKESLYDSLGLTGYGDYTDTQHEKAIDGRKISDFKPSEYWDYSKSGDENAKIYLEKCKKDGRIPKFPQFQGYEGYWKLLIDFKMYDNDGVGSPQKAVMPNFDMEAATRILNDYEGGHRQLPMAKDVVDDFVSEYRQYSRRDSDGKELTEAQAEYFKDSKVRDKNGNLRVVYHGTNSEFTVFNANPFAKEKNGLTKIKGYFSEDESYSKSYGETSAYYLNITNPLMFDNDTRTIEEWGEFFRKHGVKGVKFDSGIEEDTLIGGTFDGKTYYFPWEVIDCASAYWKGDGNVTEMIAKAGYDGLRWGYGEDAWIPFHSNQIKSVDNLNPTENDDIRYSRRDSDGKELTDAQAEFFNDSKVRDENGNLKVVYHGTSKEFYVFDINKLSSNTGTITSTLGHFFSDSVKVAKQFEESYNDIFAQAFDVRTRSETSHTKEVYLNIKNPFVLDRTDGEDSFTMLRKSIVDHAFEFTKHWAYPPKTAKEVYELPKLRKEDIVKSFRKSLIKQGYDGIVVRNTKMDSIDGNSSTFYIAFDSNQIKLTTNTNPTDSDDIRFARRSDFDFLGDEELIKRAREVSRERLREHDERIAKRTTIARIRKNTRSLNEFLVKNSKDRHIPEDLKPMVRSLVQAIDYETGERIASSYQLNPTDEDMKFINATKDKMTEYRDEQRLLNSLYYVQKSFDSVEFYGLGIEGEIDKLVGELEELRDNHQYPLMVLSTMNLEQLQTIDKLVQAVKSVVNYSNKLHTIKRNIGVDGLGAEIVSFLDKLGMGKVYVDTINKYAKVFKWLNTVPYYAFNRLGNGGKTLFGSLQDGWDKLSFNVKEIFDFADATYTKKDVEEWSKDIKDVNIGGKTYKMTVPQMMSLHCLSKREQALKHILGNGIRIANFKDGMSVVNQPIDVKVTEEDLKRIKSMLTPKQVEVADKIQEFMNTVCTDWGNYVSMSRFGYNAFGEENYFPIEVNDNNLSKDKIKDNKNVSLYALLNMGFTKSINEHSQNAIMVNDIFDVFANHSSEMAKYNALGLAVLDFNRVMNYSEIREDNPYSIRTAMEVAYGKDAESYFNKLIADLNGTQNVSRDVIGKGMMGRAKLGAIGFNIKTVLLQPTAYLKASAVIKKRYLSNPIVASPKMVKRGIERAKKYCGIALWKSMGFYDTNIGRGVVEQIKKQESLYDTLADKSTWMMEKADEITWGALWNACELEVKDTRKDLKVGSEKYFEAVAERLREVIYATQVVDSTLTRSEMMRSGDNMDKLLTAFGSEPILAYNMLLDCVMEHDILKRSGASKEVKQEQRRKVGRVLIAYTSTNLVTAILESVISSLRDEEDEEEIINEIFKNFAANMSIIGKIPYLKDVVSIFQGYSPSRMDTQGFSSMYYALNSLIKNFQGEGSAYSTYKHMMKAFSSFSGLGLWNMHRDLMAMLYQLDIFSTEELEEMLNDIFIN